MQEYPFKDSHGAVRDIMDAYGADRCLWGTSSCLRHCHCAAGALWQEARAHPSLVYSQLLMQAP